MRTVYTACSWCGGTGQAVNAYTGDPDDHCRHCDGKGTERARDKLGRYVVVEIPDIIWPPGNNEEGD